MVKLLCQFSGSYSYQPHPVTMISARQRDKTQMSISPLIQYLHLQIEPLAECICTNTNKTAINISLYADDVLLYITQPETRLPAILDKIQLFMSLSRYRIKLNKSELMFIHE